MALPGGQNVPTPRESILALSRGSQLPYANKNVAIISRIFLLLDPSLLSADAGLYISADPAQQGTGV